MNILEKLQTLIILAAVVIGIALGQIAAVNAYASSFILPFLLVMLYGLFLSVPLHQLKEAFKHVRFFSASTFINFVSTPVLAWAIGAIFLSDHPALWIGFILLMVTPCTDWYLVFTGMAKGNVPLATSILPVNLVLQVLLLPVYLLIFAGSMEMISLSTLAESLVIVFILPFGLAVLTRFILKKRKSFIKKKLLPFFSSAQIIFLSLAVIAMFASQGTYLLENMEVMYILLLPILLFFVINFGVGKLVAQWINMSYEDSVSLRFTITARNSPVALAIVITAFPDQPLIALALVIGPLIELPVLAFIAQILLRSRKKNEKKAYAPKS
ncbi:arsenic resistance protein [Alkalicoccobacillus porphyridii]|uniref:Arsenic resistance protein n=1 Tax=Alkalicoccobacillus porphyridii TaxID=2597270 RepID=A0A553ZX08_9BACI|nr:bile acid:sodium symporter [Alkalicoccobacillus porphyridii]TSB45984.1 arsenic resistance protein [Alkalicoccobacillus porphyridii]